jgi:ABC-2 type transport system permease protein
MSTSTLLDVPGPVAPAYVGTGTLLRAALRRDRRRLAIWVLALGALSVYAAVALGIVYPTAADRQARGAVVDTPAGVLLSGPGFGIPEGYTLGAMIANELSLSIMIAVAIMSIQLVVRHTRAQEESGSAELLLAGAVGRRALLGTALLLAALANTAVAVVVAAGLIGSGLAVADSVALAVGYALTGLVFAGVAAVTAQLLESARAASGTALAVLGAAALVRGLGDLLSDGGSPLSWFSPIAWVQQTRAFVDLRWSPLLLSVVLAGLLTAAALRLCGRRDMGAGLLAPRRGPADASPLLSDPAPLLARLQRGTIIGWAVTLLLVGVVFGSLHDSVTDMVAGNPRLAQAFAVEGAAGVADSFAAATASYFGLLTAGFAVASVLRLRGEETAGRAELLLAAALDRRRLLTSGLAVAGGAAALLLVAAGLGSGLASALVTGDLASVGRSLVATVVQLPAVLVLAGVAALLFGLVPRLTGLAWAVLVWALLAGMFGPLLGLPEWALRFSPFGWVPAVPAEALGIGSLVGLTLVAAALGAIAAVGYRRRDVPA